MRAAAEALRQPTRVVVPAAAGLAAALTLSAAVAPKPTAIALLVLLAATPLVAHRTLLSWEALIVQILLIVLFVPIRRYTLPGHLPFQLELYRLAVAFVALGWLGSLLVDRKVRIRRTGFEAPVGLLVFSILVSVIVNTGRIGDLGVQGIVTKKLTFFASFLLISYLIVSVIRSPRQIQIVVRTLVAGGAVLGLLAAVENRTGYNVFNNLGGFLPFLRSEALPYTLVHSFASRAYASAEHPIALGAAFVLILPLGIYLVTATRQLRWKVALCGLGLGLAATGSRTTITMLLAAILIYLWLRPRYVKRMWPLVIPAVIVLHFALPGQLGTFKEAFFPTGGLIAQQNQTQVQYGSGRVAVLGPSLEEYAERPIFGQGFGTRVTDGPTPTARLLDDQWLGSLLELGIVGFLALVWLFVRIVRRLGAAAKRTDGPLGWLYAGLAAAVAAYPIGMFTYDSFSFTQVTILLFVLIGLAATVLLGPEADRRPARERVS